VKELLKDNEKPIVDSEVVAAGNLYLNMKYQR